MTMRAFAVAALASATIAFTCHTAAAQAVVVSVNGTPITSHDVEQRMKINRLTGGKNVSRPAATQDLIDDRLKIAEARRIGYRLSDENVDDQISRLAKANNMSLSEFSGNLAKVGVDMNAYRAKARADYSWELALSNRMKSLANASSSEVNAAIEEKMRKGEAKVTDFELIPVIFVVSRTDGNVGARERAANAARAGFKGCEEGIEGLRRLPDVAIKPIVKRSSDSLSPQLAAIISKTPIGSLTPTYRSEQGVEMVAVCSKTERVDTAAVRTAAEREVTAKRGQNVAEEYIKSLRSKALIQYR